ncbi:MAG: hypothetical protein U1G07_07260 [Verrucomicrobiota bacterium]
MKRAALCLKLIVARQVACEQRERPPVFLEGRSAFAATLQPDIQMLQEGFLAWGRIPLRVY